MSDENKMFKDKILIKERCLLFYEIQNINSCNDASEEYFCFIGYTGA